MEFARFLLQLTPPGQRETIPQDRSAGRIPKGGYPDEAFTRSRRRGVRCGCVMRPLGPHARSSRPSARVQPVSDLTGAPALALALRQLATVGTLMQATAHPDDEPNGMLALYARHYGARVALVTATREMAARTRSVLSSSTRSGFSGPKSCSSRIVMTAPSSDFTHAVDFGYSFSQEETFEKWGRREILGDYVRHIRTLRPDVLVTMSPDGMGGGQHHQASAVLATEAFRAAADPRSFPNRFARGCGRGR